MAKVITENKSLIDPINAHDVITHHRYYKHRDASPGGYMTVYKHHTGHVLHYNHINDVWYHYAPKKKDFVASGQGFNELNSHLTKYRR